MKKFGGILVGLLGAGLAAVGIASVIKNKNGDEEYVDTVDSNEVTFETENADVEATEE